MKKVFVGEIAYLRAGGSSCRIPGCEKWDTIYSSMQTVRRILVLTGDAGFGHRSASNAVKAALEETYGSECQVEIINPLEDPRIPSWLRDQQTDYDRIVREIPELYKFGFKASNSLVPTAILESALTVLMFETMRDILAQYRPDSILLTYPGFQAPLAAVFATSRRYMPLITVVTDLGLVHRMWFHSASDLLVVPTSVVREVAIQNGLPAEKIQIIGIPVNPQLGKESRTPAEIRAALGWQPDLITLLAVGSKRVKNLGEVLRVLNHSGLPVQLAAVAGGDDELYQELRYIDWHVPAYIYNFVEDMPSLMHAADCLISKAGGLIVTEALACGLPMLLVDIIPGQETGNAQFIIENGAGELAEDAPQALEALFHWIDKGGVLLARRAENARTLGRPHAAYEVADLTWAAAGQGSYPRVGREILGRGKTIALLKRHGVAWNERRIKAGPTQ
jgi:1,2-diacylglycerol 3-beta-galactosyltransferase